VKPATRSLAWLASVALSLEPFAPARVLAEAFTVANVDLFARANPTGLALAAELTRRELLPDGPSVLTRGRYLEASALAELRPDGIEGGFSAAFVPIAFLELRAGFELSWFFGEYGSLLRFESRNAPFGDAVLDSLRGEEKTGVAERLYAAPVLRLRLGGLLLRNEATLSWYRMSSISGWYYESEHDTLLAEQDLLFEDRIAVLVEARGVEGEVPLRVGPFYELTTAVRSGLTRERLGALVAYTPRTSSLGWHPHLFAMLGVDVEDRNRRGELFAAAAVGGGSHLREVAVNMTRRAMVKLVGGGVLLAAVPSCGAWSTPAEATRPWSTAGEGDDPRRRALSYALLAPSPHNLQSWVVDLRREGEIVLAVDTARLLPETDPFARQVTIGQGTFLEILVLALREQGFEPRVEIFPDGEYGERPDDRPVARVTLERSDRVRHDPIFERVRSRRTNRSSYLEREVAPPTLAALLATSRSPAVEVRATLEPGLRARLAALALAAFEVEVMTERTWRESVDLMRIGASEIARHRDGIAVEGLLPWIGRGLGLANRAALVKGGGYAARKAVALAAMQTGTARAWLWTTTAGNSRREQVLAGRAYVRLHLRATGLGLALQPMSQLMEEFSEMATLHQQFYDALGLAPGTATVQMLARLGYAAAVPPSPRLDLDAHRARS
jgi:hypothetical protein